MVFSLKSSKFCPSKWNTTSKARHEKIIDSPSATDFQCLKPKQQDLEPKAADSELSSDLTDDVRDTWSSILTDANDSDLQLRPAYKLVQPQAYCTYSTNTFPGLPADLIHAIRARLPPESAAPLAFTNQQLYHVIGRCSLPLDTESRLRFLTLYEGKLPSRYLCRTCARFHHFRDARGVDLPLRECGKLNANQIGKHEWTAGDGTISFTAVQLVMNAHFFGPEHGLSPTSIFSVRRGCGDGMFSIGYVIKTEARIVNDRLILQTSHHFRGRLDYLSPFFVSQCLNFCPHLGSKNTCLAIRARVAEVQLDMEAAVRGKRVRGTKAVGRGHCKHCAMDYTTEVVRHLVRGREFVITTWRNLGSGRTTTDPDWANACDGRIYGPKAATATTQHEPGSARTAFSSVPSTAPSPKRSIASFARSYYDVDACDIRAGAEHNCDRRRVAKDTFSIQLISHPEWICRTYRYYVDTTADQNAVRHKAAHACSRVRRSRLQGH